MWLQVLSTLPQKSVLPASTSEHKLVGDGAGPESRLGVHKRQNQVNFGQHEELGQAHWTELLGM